MAARIGEVIAPHAHVSADHQAVSASQRSGHGAGQRIVHRRNCPGYRAASAPMTASAARRSAAGVGDEE